jgi:hypothetical protein
VVECAPCGQAVVPRASVSGVQCASMRMCGCSADGLAYTVRLSLRRTVVHLTLPSHGTALSTAPHGLLDSGGPPHTNPHTNMDIHTTNRQTDMYKQHASDRLRCLRPA